MRKMIVKIKIEGGRSSTYDVSAPSRAVALQVVAKRPGTVIWVCENTVHLIGFGEAPAVVGADLRVGDTLRFNYGGTALLTRIKSQTPAFITFEILEEGKPYERRIGKKRFVPVTDETFERCLAAGQVA